MAVTTHSDLSVDIAFYKSAISTAFIVEMIGLKANSLDRYRLYFFLAHAECSRVHIIEFELLVASAWPGQEQDVASTTFKA